jgi:hypothetical protein
MTIAVCYLSPEGVVLGADSTATGFTPWPHYLNYAQKIFEVGEIGGKDTLGVLTWGLGGTGLISHRTLVARLADGLATGGFKVIDAANKWIDLYWQEYSVAFAPQLARAAALTAKGGTRSPPETAELENLGQQFTVGFCLGGYSKVENRVPFAYQTIFDPRLPKPSPVTLPINVPMYWGAPNMIRRLLTGIDPGLLGELLASGKWAGQEGQLLQIVQKYTLNSSSGALILPIRDAIDFVHSSIYSTIKAHKFSQFPQICGGPIEIAVITSDRPFRWVRHKRFDAAITEQEGEAWPNDIQSLKR